MRNYRIKLTGDVNIFVDAPSMWEASDKAAQEIAQSQNLTQAFIRTVLSRQKDSLIIDITEEHVCPQKVVWHLEGLNYSLLVDATDSAIDMAYKAAHKYGGKMDNTVWTNSDGNSIDFKDFL